MTPMTAAVMTAAVKTAAVKTAAVKTAAVKLKSRMTRILKMEHLVQSQVISIVRLCLLLTDAAADRTLRNVFYPCFLSHEVGNLYCPNTLPAVQQLIQERTIPVIAKGFQIYNSTKSLLRPSRQSQPYYNAIITNQLANAVSTDKVISRIRSDYEKNKQKIEKVASITNGNNVVNIIF